MPKTSDPFTTVLSKRAGPNYTGSAATVIRKGSKAGEAFASGAERLAAIGDPGKYKPKTVRAVAREMSADQVAGVAKKQAGQFTLSKERRK